MGIHKDEGKSNNYIKEDKSFKKKIKKFEV